MAGTEVLLVVDIHQKSGFVNFAFNNCLMAEDLVL